MGTISKSEEYNALGVRSYQKFWLRVTLTNNTSNWYDKLKLDQFRDNSSNLFLQREGIMEGGGAYNYFFNS